MHDSKIQCNKSIIIQFHDFVHGVAYDTYYHDFRYLWNSLGQCFVWYGSMCFIFHIHGRCREGEIMKKQIIKTCPQCGHMLHLPIKDESNGTFSGGCSCVVFIQPKKGGGYYHEHCDCDYDILEPHVDFRKLRVKTA